MIKKSLFVSRDRGVRVDVSTEGTNITNRRNFNKVWDQFDPNNLTPTFANGTTANLLKGPYNFKGFVPTSPSQLQQTPLAFIGVDNPRRVQFGLRIAF